MTPALMSWSGGKDSSLALSALRAARRYDVVGLVTTVTQEYDRISVHGVRRTVLEAQTAALGLPLIEARISRAAGNAEYELAFEQALETARLRWPGLSHIAFGDLFLTDVRSYRDGLLARLGWSGLYPVWSEDTRRLAERFVTEGYRAILTCVDTTQLDASFAGREFDEALLNDLPAGVDPCGERGEFHTCVYAGPIFRHPVTLVVGECIRREERFQYCDVFLRALGSAASIEGSPAVRMSRPMLRLTD